jgi:hypothetical protein
MHRESTRYRYSISEEYFYIGREISVGWYEMDSVGGARVRYHLKFVILHST